MHYPSLALRKNDARRSTARLVADCNVVCIFRSHSSDCQRIFSEYVINLTAVDQYYMDGY